MTWRAFICRAVPAALLLLMAAGCALFGGGRDDRAYRDPVYEVEKGDTLYSIAWDHDLDYRELADWNGIGPPYLIRPGQELRLSAPRGRATARREDDAPVASGTSSPVPAREPLVVTKDDEAPPPGTPAAPAAAAGAPLRWRWPAGGELLRRYDPAGGSAGIDIGGAPGEQIRAAGNGRVVYGGSGLQGYGLLLIVKHDDNYLSAYGYNRKLLVQQGDEVHVGQPVAEMGEGPQRKPILHFEIRRGGKTMDPLQLLPPRP